MLQTFFFLLQLIAYLLLLLTKLAFIYFYAKNARKAVFSLSKSMSSEKKMVVAAELLNHLPNSIKVLIPNCYSQILDSSCLNQKVGKSCDCHNLADIDSVQEWPGRVLGAEFLFCKQN